MKQKDNIADNKDYRVLKEFFINDKCLPIIEFFLKHSDHYYTRAEILDMANIDKGTLNRYLPVLSKSRYNILITQKHTFEGKRNNTTIYALNKEYKYNLTLQKLLFDILEVFSPIQVSNKKAK